MLTWGEGCQRAGTSSHPERAPLNAAIHPALQRPHSHRGRNHRLQRPPRTAAYCQLHQQMKEIRQPATGKTNDSSTGRKQHHAHPQPAGEGPPEGSYGRFDRNEVLCQQRQSPARSTGCTAPGRLGLLCLRPAPPAPGPQVWTRPWQPSMESRERCCPAPKHSHEQQREGTKHSGTYTEVRS